MKASLFLTLAAASIALSNVLLDRANACSPNNCLRGVGGTAANAKPPLTSRLSDCSSFMLTTITPTPVTITYTQTYTTTLPVGMKRDVGEIQDRQVVVTPKTVPAYATYCSNAAAYSSACSCESITAQFTIAPTPTITAYAVGPTVSVCPFSPFGTETNCGGTCYNLETSADNCGACGFTCAATEICNNGFCEPDVTLYQCDNPNTSGCLGEDSSCGQCGECHPDNFGQGYCVANGNCNPTDACDTDLDCFSGICLELCCNFTTGKFCQTVVDNLCYTPPTAPKMLFAMRR